jgi:enamine deaminase RidA (YjgF/YER057c/UK114 family)
LGSAINAAGGTLEKIVMLRIYIVNYQKEDIAIISQILKDTFGTRNPPASSWLNVQGLANDGFMIEIEAQAVI